MLPVFKNDCRCRRLIPGNVGGLQFLKCATRCDLSSLVRSCLSESGSPTHCQSERTIYHEPRRSGDVSNWMPERGLTDLVSIRTDGTRKALLVRRPRRSRKPEEMHRRSIQQPRAGSARWSDTEMLNGVRSARSSLNAGTRQVVL